MGAVRHQRIAQRFAVATTPIEWVVPKRRGANPRSRLVVAEAAVIEMSVMGAAIVCPLKWRAIIGTKVEVRWEGLVGRVLIRREVPFPGSTKLAMYGVEFADSPSPLGQALFDHLVALPAEAAGARVAAAAAEAVVNGTEPGPSHADPALWSAPNAWSPDAR